MGVETAAFMAGRVSLIASVVDPDGSPRAVRGWGLRVLSLDEALVRVVLDAEDRDAIAPLPERGGRIAVTGCDVPTLRACQLKGTVQSVEAADDGDRALLERYCDEVFADIHEADALPLELLARLRPDDVVACVFTVEETYDQTPGPGAGGPLPEAVR